MQENREETEVAAWLERDKKLVGAMIRFYCRHRHGEKGGLCSSCTSLQVYASARLARCPYGGERKPVCSGCTSPCYSRAMREKMRDVMVFAGPGMILHHPFLVFRHLVQRFRRPPHKAQPGGTQGHSLKR